MPLNYSKASEYKAKKKKQQAEENASKSTTNDNGAGSTYRSKVSNFDWNTAKNNVRNVEESRARHAYEASMNRWANISGPIAGTREERAYWESSLQSSQNRMKDSQRKMGANDDAVFYPNASRDYETAYRQFKLAKQNLADMDLRDNYSRQLDTMNARNAYSNMSYDNLLKTIESGYLPDDQRKLAEQALKSKANSSQAKAMSDRYTAQAESLEKELEERYATGYDATPEAAELYGKNMRMAGNLRRLAQEWGERGYMAEGNELAQSNMQNVAEAGMTVDPRSLANRYDDDQYQFIMGNGQKVNPTAASRNRILTGKEQAAMTANEKLTYAQIYDDDRANGTNNADRYLKWLQYSLGERIQQRKQNEINAKMNEQRAGSYSAEEFRNLSEDQQLRSALSDAEWFVRARGANLASGVGAIDAAIQKLNNNMAGDYYKPVNWNSAAFTPHTVQETITQNQLSRIDSPVGQFAYQTAGSMADSLVVMGAAMLGIPATTSILGGAAATDAMVKAKERGASDTQAISAGLFSGVAEALFENVSLERLLTAGTPATIKEVLKNIFLRQGFTEASEEVFTTISNTLTDAILLGDTSEIKTNIRMYKEQGYSQSDAEKLAAIEWAKNLGLDALGGFVSGAIFGGVEQGVSYGRFRGDISSIENAGDVNEAIGAYQRGLGRVVDENGNVRTDSANAAKQLQETYQRTMEGLTDRSTQYEEAAYSIDQQVEQGQITPEEAEVKKAFVEFAMGERSYNQTTQEQRAKRAEELDKKARGIVQNMAENSTTAISSVQSIVDNYDSSIANPSDYFGAVRYYEEMGQQARATGNDNFAEIWKNDERYSGAITQHAAIVAFSAGKTTAAPASKIMQVTERGTGELKYSDEAMRQLASNVKNVNDAVELLTAFAKKTGLTLNLDESLADGENAKFIASAMTIAINPRANVIAGLFHESGHVIQRFNPQDYAQLKADMISWYAQTQGMTNLDQMLKQYGKAYKGYSRDALEVEMTNDAFGALFNRADAAEDIANWLTENKTEAEQKSFIDKLNALIDRIINWVKGLVNYEGVSPMQKKTIDMQVEKAQAFRDAFLSALDEASEAARAATEYRVDVDATSYDSVAASKSMIDFSLNVSTLNYAAKYTAEDEESAARLKTLRDALQSLWKIEQDIKKGEGKTSHSIHDINKYLESNPAVHQRLLDVQKAANDAGITCDFVTPIGEAVEVEGKEVAPGLRGLPIEYVEAAEESSKYVERTSDKYRHVGYKFTAFKRTIPQMFLDSIPNNVSEVLRKDMVKAVEDAYAKSKGSEILTDIDKAFPTVRELKTVAAQSTRSNVNNKTMKGVQAPLRSAEKTVMALNLNSACPMFTIGNHGCYLDACYLTQMANGATGTNLFRTAWYTGELLQLNEDAIKTMRDLGGLRINGVGDTIMDNKSQLVDVLKHAAMRNLAVKIITKQAITFDVLSEAKKAGVDLSQVTVQPSMDNLWIPAALDDAYGAGVRGDTQLADTVKKGNFDAAMVAYDEFFGRATKEAPALDDEGNPILDDDGNPVMTVYRKYGFSPEQVQEMMERANKEYPEVTVTPRYVVCTPEEIAEIALNRNKFVVNGGAIIQTLMHGKVPEGCVSDYGTTIVNFGGLRHVIERRNGQWDFYGATVSYLTEDVVVNGVQQYTKKGKKKTRKVKRNGEFVTVVKRASGKNSPYQAVLDYVNGTVDGHPRFTEQEKNHIWNTLRATMCCQASMSKDACAGCSSLCASGATLANVKARQSDTLQTVEEGDVLPDWVEKMEEVTDWAERRANATIVDYSRTVNEYTVEDLTDEQVYARENITEAQREIREKNLSNENVGSTLYTLNGTKIKRSSHGVGKDVGGQIYVHKDYVSDVVPTDDYKHAESLLKQTDAEFEYNTIMYDPKRNIIRFDEAPNFDTAREPFAGNYYTVNLATGIVTHGYSDSIWHHKWQWVKNDYTGFDVEESWKWSREWLSYLRYVPVEEHKFEYIGNQKGVANGTGHGNVRWNEQISYYGLRIDNESGSHAPDYSLRVVAEIPDTEHTGPWQNTKTTDEAREIAAEKGINMWDVTAEDSDERNATQIVGTRQTYKKFLSYFSATGFNGRVLDASSGLGAGTRVLREGGYNVTDIEPYADDYTYGYDKKTDVDVPLQNVTITKKDGTKKVRKDVPVNPLRPMYTDYQELERLVETGEVQPFDFIISNAVLNVLPQDQRDACVVAMGNLLAPGGKMFINVRSKNEINTELQKHPEYARLGDAEMVEGTDGSYQYGFSPKELLAYIQDRLGPGFTVEPTSKTLNPLLLREGEKIVGSPSVMVTKNEDIRYSLSVEDFEEYKDQIGDAVGVNINDSTQPFTQQILDLQKDIETRDNTRLRHFIGHRVGLVRTDGKGNTFLVGMATISSEKTYHTKEEFDADYDRHLVGDDNETYRWKDGGTKYGYVLTDVKPILDKNGNRVELPVDRKGNAITTRQLAPDTADMSNSQRASLTDTERRTLEKRVREAEARAKQEKQRAEHFKSELKLTPKFAPNTEQITELAEEFSTMFDATDVDVDAVKAKLTKVFQNMNRATEYKQERYAYTALDIAQEVAEDIVSASVPQDMTTTLDSNIMRDEAVVMCTNAITNRLLQVRLAKSTKADKWHAKLQEAQQALGRETTKVNRAAQRINNLEAEFANYRQNMADRIAFLRASAAEQHSKDMAKLKQTRASRDQKIALRKVSKVVKDLRSYLEKPDPKTGKYVQDNVKGPVAQFLFFVDFLSSSFANNHVLTQSDYRELERLEGIKRIAQQSRLMELGDSEAMDSNSPYLDLPSTTMYAIEGLRAYVKAKLGEFRDAEDLGLADEGMMHLKVSDAEALETVYDLAKSIQWAVKKMNTLFAKGKYASVEQMSRDTVKHLEGVKKSAKVNPTLYNSLGWSMATPYYAFHRFGEAGDTIFANLGSGLADFARNINTILDFVEGYDRKGKTGAFTRDEQREWSNQIVEVDVDGDRKLKMTVSQLMSLYCLSRREAAQNHLTQGGIALRETKTKTDTVSQEKAVHLTAKNWAHVFDQLTDRQKEVARKLQEFMSTVGSDWGNKVTMERWGVHGFTEKFYFPMATSDAARSSLTTNDSQSMSLYALANMGFTKALQKYANNALVLDDIFNVFSDHMANMAKYSSMVLPMLDAMKWYNWSETNRVIKPGGQKELDVTSLKTAVKDAFGGAATQYFRQFMTDLNAADKEGGAGYDIGSRLMSHYKAAAVGANLRVALLQPTAFFRAAMELSPADLAKGAAMRGGQEEMMKYSGIAQWKDLGFYDTDIGRSVRRQIQGEKTKWGVFKNKAVDISMMAAQWGDKITWAALWNACKIEQRRANPNVSYEELMGLTEKRFNQVIFATQVFDSTLSRSEVMRSKDGLKKLITAFMSEPTLSYNMVLDKFFQYSMDVQKLGKGEAWKKHGNKITKSLAVYTVTNLVAALAESFADAWRDDDDDSYWKKMMDKMFGDWSEVDDPLKAVKQYYSANLMNDMSVLGKIPILKEIVSLFQGFDIGGRMDVQALQSIWNALAIWNEKFNLMTGKLDKATKETWYGNMTTYGAIYKSLQAASQVSGIPAANAMRDIIGIYNTTLGKLTGKLLTYEAKYDKVDSALDGTQAGIDKAIADAVAKGNAEKDVISHIKSTVKKRYTGEEGDPMSRDEAKKLLMDTVGLKEPAAEKELNKWTMVKDTGIAYDDMKEAYLNGDITEEEAVDYRVKYGGVEQEDAEKTVAGWKAENETGYAKSDIDDDYIAGNISRAETIQLYMDHGDTKEDATDKVDLLDFKQSHPGAEDFEIGHMKNYKKTCERAKVPVEVFYDVVTVKGNTKADVDAKGKSISGSAKKKVLSYINKLSVSKTQKDALYYACGYAESEISKAPWH